MRIGQAACGHLALGLVLLLGGEPSGRGAWTGAMVPAYFGPQSSTDWERLAEAAGRIPLIAIANVFNGPGTSARSDYRQVLGRVRAAGGRVIGYVHTTYTQRALAEVLADVDRWSAFYEIDGIFVDEMTQDGAAAGLEYYRAIVERARSRNTEWIVVGNPGTTTREVYLAQSAADVLVTFENRTGYPGYLGSAWTRRYPAGAFVHLCYEVAESEVMEDYLRRARSRGAGWVYVTDDRLPNPWDRLPGYWEPEVETIRLSNREEPVGVSWERAAGNSVRLKIRSIPGRHVVESSEDLLRWIPWLEVPARTGEVEVVVPLGEGDGRFLRVSR